jgi:hypothetical protein
MKLALASLPDCKMLHKHLTLGKEYEIQGWLGNGYVIKTDNDDSIVILQERLIISRVKL